MVMCVRWFFSIQYSKLKIMDGLHRHLHRYPRDPYIPCTDIVSYSTSSSMSRDLSRAISPPIPQSSACCEVDLPLAMHAFPCVDSLLLILNAPSLD